MKRAGVACLAAFILTLVGSGSGAQEIESSTDTGGGMGINFDVGFATAYVFRGLNVFMDDDQRDQNMLIAPGISWSIFDTGLGVGYWGAYQLNGDDVSGHIDRGIGAEQDLFVTYELKLPHDLGLNFWVVYYFFPAADPDLAEVTNPSYLEPGMRFGIYSILDLYINFAYFAGLQEEIRDASYFYINPMVGKNFEFGEVVGLEISLGYGYKVWKDDSIVNNTHDVTFRAALPISLPSDFYVTPAINVARTNFEVSHAGDTTNPNLPPSYYEEIADQPHETVVWGSVNVGVEL